MLAQSQPNSGLSATVRNEISDFGKMPLHFEPNVGQTDPSVQFMARSPQGTIFFRSRDVVLSVARLSSNEAGNGNSTTAPKLGLGKEAEIEAAEKKSKDVAISVTQIQFLGANINPTIKGEAVQDSKVNYFMGNNPSKWHSNIPTYGVIRYSNLYPGIDLQYDGITSGELKGTYEIAPGANVQQINWRYNGAQSVSVDAAGNLRVLLPSQSTSSSNNNTGIGMNNGSVAGGVGAARATGVVTITEQAPVSWQIINGRMFAVETRFAVASDGNVSFQLGNYDRTQPLTIDPTLSYSTYLGGSDYETGWNVSVDVQGNSYVLGWTLSTDYPTQNPPQPSNGGDFDTYITKFNEKGTNIIYSTYLGGSASDYGNALAIDADGNAYVGGDTDSTDFPTQDPIQSTNHGAREIFITKLDSTGSALSYSTYLGGTNYDYCRGIAVDSSGSAYLSGSSYGYGFPITTGVAQSSQAGNLDAVVVKLNSSGSALEYSTYVGGSDYDSALAIAVDASGYAYIAGDTYSTDFPTEVPYQGSRATTDDAFITAVDTDGSSFIYSTYLGGNGPEFAQGIAVDGTAHVYITGLTRSSNLPVPNGYQTSYGGNTDAFVAKLNPTIGSSGLDYLTYLGGVDDDEGNGIAIDGSGNVYVAGLTASSDFPKQDSYQSGLNGTYDAFVSEISSSGSNLLYSTYLGGTVAEVAYGIAVDLLGDVYVNGVTGSSDFPTRNAFQNSNGGLEDAFVTKIAMVSGVVSSIVQPEELRCGGSPSERSPALDAGNMVNTDTGNFCHSSTEISIPGHGFPLALNLTYNSDLAAITSTITNTLGSGWTHGYNMYVEQEPSGQYWIHEENGSITPFNQDLSAPIRVMATLTQTDGIFYYTRLHDNAEFWFADPDNSGIYRLLGVRDLHTCPPLPDECDGYQINLIHDSLTHLLSEVVDPVARTLEFTYTNGLLTSVKAQGYAPVSLTYSATNLITITDVGSQQTHYTYDANHLLRTIQDPNGGILTNDYNSENRVRWQTDPMSNTIDFDYSVTLTSTSTMITDMLGLVTLHKYTYNMIKQVIANPGDQQAIWNYSYWPDTTWVYTETDPLSHTTTRTYDTHGDELSWSDPLSRTTVYTSFNAYFNYGAVINPRNEETVYDYNDNGTLLDVYRPWDEGPPDALQETFYSYEDTNWPDSPTSIRDPKQVADPVHNPGDWETTYDSSFGYPRSNIDPEGGTTVYTYNSVGLLLKVRDPNGHETSYGYDEYGGQTIVTDTMHFTSTVTYDNNRNVRTKTDANGRTTTYSYNKNNQVIRVDYPDASHEEYQYDGVGRTSFYTDTLGQLTQYTYDDIHRITTVEDPLLRTTQTLYDAVGNTIIVTDTDGNPTTYSYDDAYHLKNIDYTQTPLPNLVFHYNVSYDYNELGQRTFMSTDEIDPPSQTFYTYDSLDRLITYHPDASPIITYTYDLNNNVNSIWYPSYDPENFPDSTSHVVTHEYSPTNRLKSVTDWLDNTTSFGYDPVGNLTTITRPDSPNTSHIYYNAASEIVTMTHTITATPFLTFSYPDRDNIGLITAASEDPSGNHTYEYDSLNRLSQDTHEQGGSTHATTWGYDAADQITQSTYKPTSSSAPVTTTLSYDPGGELSTLTENTSTATTISTTFQYDDLGGRIYQTDSISGKETYYNYDEAHRLVGYYDTISDNGTGYRYDGDGLLMEVTNPEFKYLDWDISSGLPNVIQEERVTVELPEFTYVEHESSFIYGPGGLPLEEVTIDAGAEEESVNFYYTDQLGSIRALSDSSGNVIATYDYSPYGKLTASTGTTYNPILFAGEYTDNMDSNLVYLRARWYDPTTMQFMSKDTMTGSPYSYASGDPTNLTDPSGHCSICVAVAVGIGVGVLFDVGSDFVFDNSNFDFWSSVGNAVTDPWTYIGAIPLGGTEISVVLRASTKSAAKGAIVRVGENAVESGFGKITNLRGKSVQWLKRNKPQGWRTLATENKQGWRWLDENGHERLRFYRPTGNNPASEQWSRQSTGYIRWRNAEGAYLDIEGNIVSLGAGDFAERTHVPYEGP
jgi:RHS repeat-associated protein